MLLDEARRLLITTGSAEERSSRALSRLVAAGSLIRLRPGVHVDAIVWARLRHEERLQLRILALALTSRTRPVFSHWSAAVLHGKPVPRRACDAVDVALEASRNRVLVGARAHAVALRPDDVVEIDGLLCTSLLRTLVDVAADEGFEEAVVLGDALYAALGDGAKERARAALDASGRRRGAARAGAVLDFADGRSGSPGESVSRVRIHRLGFARPELQVPIEVDGHRYEDDFDWEEVGTAGEFDGELKYREDRFRLGGSVADVVIREKNRENRMRRRRPRFARWDWSDLLAGRLERILLDACVPKRNGRA
ncbi:hypothetical protein [Amnibacterium kyonggiense]|uniref:Transcriptional regulator, AbiEi antitoxin, Type IV TA system n=1 Tax=Amnibacterium kyonggiense TaxID=595671 RepID=A0A4R7FQY4_9MICO|nr:hypothetical protein [Amnibacterium kyonggiense]TDS80126.1 hypothetical protein CLV52_0680 [Amnibacterium kyonggiense]